MKISDTISNRYPDQLRQKKLTLTAPNEKSLPQIREWLFFVTEISFLI